MHRSSRPLDRSVGNGSSPARPVPIPEKSCSQCRVRKIKCDMDFPNCGGCAIRGLACEFTARRKPGPPKGAKRKRHQHDQQNKTVGLLNDRAGHRSSHASDTRSRSPSPSPLFDGEGHAVPLPAMEMAEVSPSEGNSSFSQESDKRGLTDLENCCIDAYPFVQHFPYLPPLGRDQIFESSVDEHVRLALIQAVCAVSVTSARGVRNMSVTSRREAASSFAKRAKSAFLRRVLEQDLPVTLNIVKIAAILAAYELTCSPGGKGWSMVGETVRLAYDMGLDQVDGSQHIGTALLSLQEAEEQRYVWWCVYALDTYVSSTLMRPFAITDTAMKTALVGVAGRDNSHELVETFFLPSDPVKLQMKIQSLDHSRPQSPEILNLLLLSMVRLISALRRQQLEGEEVGQGLELIRNLLASWWFSLPEDFLHQSSATGVRPRAKVLSIETVILAHLSSLSVDSFSIVELERHGYLGSLEGGRITQEQWGSGRQTPSFSAWEKCISSAMGILGIVRNLSPQELCEMSPFSSVVLWLPAVVLALQMRTSRHKKDRENAESALQVLKAALRKLASFWSIARCLEEAIHLLCANLGSSTSIQEACHILHMYGSVLESSSAAQITVRIPPLAIARPAPLEALDDELYCGDLQLDMDHLESWLEMAPGIDVAAFESDPSFSFSAH
ncbi:hypothetical protein B0J13DRAFT_564280 [Dactylonectria estremocensis]|uniref:Zn(2)-C6 fungal-type domain-containing protein n=1 Tax=Dactylonectria estremocensis TaxID=1079267 RepID=A0A9P9E2K0_9HYPO|nr:hypothetical protein B0J13DRAFT_564280 [Dactylonectria estremocensis]